MKKGYEWMSVADDRGTTDVMLNIASNNGKGINFTRKSKDLF